MGEKLRMLDEVSGKWVVVEGDAEKASIEFYTNLRPDDKVSDQEYRKTAHVEVFKLSDVPKTMRKKGWHMGARLQERWFKNRAYKMSLEAKNKATSDLLNYPKDLICTDEISWAWLFSFPRVVKKYNELVSVWMNSPKIKNSILATIKKNGHFKTSNFKETPQTFTVDASDIMALHAKWQIQMIPVDNSPYEKAARYFEGADDLTAAMAGFSLYAAIKSFTLYKTEAGHGRCIVNSIAVYSLDDYDFNDDKQYLGHWNKEDVKIVMPVQLASMAKQELQNPIPASSGTLTLKGAYFSVFNHQYNRYRTVKNKGGDMFVFSPIRIHNMNNLFVDAYL